MEAASLALGIVSLYSAAIDILGRVDAYNKFGGESQTILLHYEAAKIRLQDWADNVGIRDGKLADQHSPRLDEPKRAVIIKMALETLTKLLNEVDQSSSSIKLPTGRPSAESDLWITPLDKARSKPEHHQALSKRSRIAWAMGGKDQLIRNVAAFEGLVNVLYQVANPSDGGADQLVSTLPSKENEEPLMASEVALKSTLESLIALDRREILDWLDALKYDDEQEKHLSSHLNGTCEWILRHPAYVEWESSPTLITGAKFLWIHAPAGFGKTVLSAWLIHHIKDILKIPIASCFSSSHAQGKQEYDSIIRTWITQLAQHDMEVLNLCQTIRRKQSARRASRSNIWSLFRQVALQLPSCILTLDGLDEFPTVDDTRGLFLENVKEAVASTQVKVLLTSRNEADIEAKIGVSTTRPHEYTMLECKVTKEDVKDDVSLYSRSVIAKRFPRQDESFREDLSAQIAERADGMFLWIKLQQSQLRASQSRKTIQRIVAGMAHGLDQTYDRNWGDIQELAEPDRNRAIDILRWLTFAGRPFTVQQLVEALIIELDEDSEAFCVDDLPAEIDAEYVKNEIKGLCGSFIDIRDEAGTTSPAANTIYLAHASVWEYLITILPSPVTGAISLQENLKVAAYHALLASYCLRFLNCAQAWATDAKGYYRPFTAYAVHSWFRHIQWSRLDNQYPVGLFGLLHQFLRSGNDNFRLWQLHFENPIVLGGNKNKDEDEDQDEDDDEDDDKDEAENKAASGGELTSKDNLMRPSALYYACLFGLHPILDLLLTTEEEHINSVGGRYGTPLQVACVFGYQSVFDRLMRCKVDVSQQGGPDCTAINAAARWGRHEMVKSLLAHEALTDQSRSQTLPATISAAKGGYVKVVRLLLDHGAVTASNNDSDPEISACLSNALLEAAGFGHLAVVKLMLERGVDINVRNNKNDTSLHLAAAYNHVAVAAELIRRGASVSVRGEFGHTPLHTAAIYGSTEIASHAITHGADVNAQCVDGTTALYHAVSVSCLDMIILLLDKRADINISSANGRRAIHVAAEKGLVDILQLLIQHGADVNTQSETCYTPLYLACYHNNLDAVRLLLDQRVDINLSSADGCRAIQIAAQKGHIDLLQLLIQSGAEVDYEDVKQWSPLCYASFYGHKAVAQLLLQHGANARIDSRDGTPLHLCAERAYLDIADLLLKSGADPNARDEIGVTPLHIAIGEIDSPESADYEQRFKVVELLLEHKANPNPQDEEGLTPLHVALVVYHNTKSADYEQRFKVIELLLEHKADPNPQDKEGMTPLHAALLVYHNTKSADYQQFLKMLELLLKYEADLDITDKTERTLLSYAIDGEYIALARYLISKGCDVNVKVCWEGKAKVLWSHSVLRDALEFAPDELIEDFIQRGANLSAVDRFGMTCLDWIKRQRPHLQCGDKGVTGPNMTLLSRNASGLAALLKKDSSNWVHNFYRFSKGLLMLDMELDAMLAYQVGFLAKEGDSEPAFHCGGCKDTQTREHPFYMCKSCPYTDLCHTCMAKYGDSLLFDHCKNHDFLRIVASEARITPDQKEALEEWLSGILQRLRHVEDGHEDT
ncbi:MAG: hypothetical protein Q9209_001424 [Squamulea sp. 1 TL-2023]